MILVLHIIIALFAVFISWLAYVKPSKAKLKLCYLLTISTFVTGGYLLTLKPSHIVTSCILGIIFLGFVGSMIFAARNRLSRLSSHTI